MHLAGQVTNVREQLVSAESAIRELFPAGIPDDATHALDKAELALRDARTAVSSAGVAARKAEERASRAAGKAEESAGALKAMASELTRVVERTLAAAGAIAVAVGNDTLAEADGDSALRMLSGETPESMSHALSVLTRRHEDYAGALAAARANSTSVKARLEADLRSSLAVLGGDPACTDRVPEAVSRLDNAVRSAYAQTIQLKAQIEHVSEKLAERAGLESDMERLETETLRYKRLGHELRGDRFIKYVLEESFQDLAIRASDELLELSGNRYSLAADGYDFVVIDHSNGDERRSVSTLSGGESFLASLSLAIALAQGIRDIGGASAGARLEAVFIDEGFGSLDSGSLELVIDTLERLQGSDRVVGLITHVESLAERVASGLTVSPAASGSIVRPRMAE